MERTRIRNYQADDLLRLAQLINEADGVDSAGYATTAEALAHRLAGPDVQPTDNLFLAECGDRLVGYVLLLRRPEQDIERVGAVGIVHPQWRRQGIGTALMQRAEQRARQMSRNKLLYFEMYVRAPVSGAEELALSLGMQPVRYSYYMECHDLEHLPKPAFPLGIRMRPFVVDQDEEEFLQAYNDGFSDHWGFVPATLEQVRHWEGSPGFRPENTLLAVNEVGRIVGLCTVLFPQVEARMSEPNPPMIDDLAVIRRYRRQGIGRGLLLAGMRYIRAAGYQVAALGVDADNPNQAARLYESVGFRVVSRSTVFRKGL